MVVDVIEEIYTKIKKTLGNNVNVVLGEIYETAKFPCVVVNLIDDTCNEHIDSGGGKFCSQSIEIAIYTETPNYYQKRKKLKEDIDFIMSSEYNMNRGYSGEVPNYLDRNINRYVMRYSYNVDVNKKIYRS